MDDILDTTLEAASATDRQTAVLASAAHTWNGQALHPFSIRRESLYFRLRASQMPLPIQTIMAHPESFLQDAMIILWLCAHEPKDWQPMKGSIDQLMDAVETWAEKNIQRLQQTDATLLAMQILREGDATRAQAQPSDRPGSEDRLGN